MRECSSITRGTVPGTYVRNGAPDLSVNLRSLLVHRSKTRQCEAMRGNATQHKQASYLHHKALRPPPSRGYQTTTYVTAMIYTSMIQQQQCNTRYLIIIEHFHIEAPGVVGSARLLHRAPISPVATDTKKQASKASSSHFAHEVARQLQPGTGCSQQKQQWRSVSIGIPVVALHVRVPCAEKQSPRAAGQQLFLCTIFNFSSTAEMLQGLVSPLNDT